MPFCRKVGLTSHMRTMPKIEEMITLSICISWRQILIHFLTFGPKEGSYAFVSSAEEELFLPQKKKRKDNAIDVDIKKEYILLI